MSQRVAEGLTGDSAGGNLALVLASCVTVEPLSMRGRDISLFRPVTLSCQRDLLMSERHDRANTLPPSRERTLHDDDVGVDGTAADDDRVLAVGHDVQAATPVARH